jgi:hypothetical protein
LKAVWADRPTAVRFRVNNEKITPYFLSLAKKPHNSESLLDVRRDDGENFDNVFERDTYIRDYLQTPIKKFPTL